MRTIIPWLVTSVLLLGGRTHAQQLVGAEYFLDADPGVGSGIVLDITPGNTISETFSIPTAGIPTGFHTLNTRFKNADGVWGHAVSRLFYIYGGSGGGGTDPAPPIGAGEYFIDADPGVGAGTAFAASGATVNTSFAVDMSGVPAGFHTLSTRLKDTEGHWGHAVSRLFFIYSGSGGGGIDPAPPIAAGEYYIDTDPGVGAATAFAASGSTVSTIFGIALTGVPSGFHTLCMRFKDADGRWGHAVSRLFYIYSGSGGGGTDPAAALVGAEYFFDADPGVGNGTVLPTGAPQDEVALNTVIDASALPVGTHTLNIRFKDADGRWGHTRSEPFVVLPEGGLQNDECLGAIALPLNAYGACPGAATAGSTEEATTSGTTACWGGEYNDVWYSINSGSSLSISLDVLAVTAQDIRVEVYEGCEGTLLQCLSGTPMVFGTAPNSNYLVRVFGVVADGSFGICASAGQIDCLGVPGGTAWPGNPCDDADPNSPSSYWDGACECQPYDCTGQSNGIYMPGTPCPANWYPVGATNAMLGMDCQCHWTDCEGTPDGPVADSDGDGLCDTVDSCPYLAGELGGVCDDGNEASVNDNIQANCACQGYAFPCASTQILFTSGGDWENAVFPSSNSCMGQYASLHGVAVPVVWGAEFPETTVSKEFMWDTSQPEHVWLQAQFYYGAVIRINGVEVYMNPDCTVGYTNDLDITAYLTNGTNTLTITANSCGGCGSIAVLVYSTDCPVDCAGSLNGTALPGTPCDDGDSDTANDTWDTDCECTGEPLDCAGVIGGTSLPGTDCLEGGLAGTWSVECECEVEGPDVAVRNVIADQDTLEPGTTVIVSWEVHNLGSASATVTWTERIHLESPQGQFRTLLAQNVHSSGTPLEVEGILARSTSVSLPSLITVGDQARFVVEIVPGEALIELPNSAANNTGVQGGTCVVRKLLRLLSPLTVGEGNTISATVQRNGSILDALTVDIGSTTPARFVHPTTVTIQAGQSGRAFTIQASENAALEGSIQSTFTVASPGFVGSERTLTIIDNELPMLTIGGLPAATMEGDTLDLSITVGSAPTQALTVALLSSDPARFPLPTQVIIPSSSTSVSFQVILPQDNIPELTVSITLQASATGQAPTSAQTTLDDDDMPGLQLVISTDTVSESGGAAAAQGTLLRLPGSNSIAFTAELSADPNNTLILPTSITLAQNENAKTFTIGVVDNAQVDGFRDVEITAALIIPGCGCGAPPSTAGHVQSGLTVADNDGPTLTLLPQPLSLAEGLASAAILRVQRNTPTNTALEVSLSTSDPDEATLPTTALIPIGSAHVDVPITTVNDGTPDGSQQVYLNASASGYAPGIAWVIVTDVNKPDLIVTHPEVSATTLPALGQLSYEVSVTNAGFATAPTGVLLRAYLSTDATIDADDVVLSSEVISAPIPAGHTVVVQGTATLPAATGERQLLFRANPLSTLSELLYTNNTSEPVAIQITAPLTATAVVAQSWYFRGSAVTITGTAQWLDATPASNQQIEVYVLVNGLRREIMATTNAGGAFTTTFTPLPNEAGHYTVGASYPDLGANTEQDAFDLLGVEVNNGAAIAFPVALGDTLIGKLAVRNLCDVGLPVFTLLPTNLPSGAAMAFDTIPLLAGQATDSISYRVTGNSLSQGMDYIATNLTARAAQGALHPVQAWFFCQAPGSHLVADQTAVNVTMSVSMGQQLVEVRVRNIGMGATGPVQVQLPQASFLSLMTPATIPSLSPGDSAVVVLRFQALAEVPFDFPISGSLAFDPENGNTLTIPFTFTKVSQTSGEVVVDVTNQFTYYAAGAPKVEGAMVTIQHYYTGEIYAQGLTNGLGRFSPTGIPEGTHRITVTKDQHLSYSGTVTIVPGGSVFKPVFLNYQAITFSWTVVPTAIEDEYTITLTMEFETNVPMPVVTIDMPDTMPQLQGDETFPFLVTFVNHGLITARDVTLLLPETDPEYEFITNYIPSDLAALSSIQVPVLMRRRLEPLVLIAGAPSVEGISQFLGMAESQYAQYRDQGLGCRDVVRHHYWYVCNLSNGLWEPGAHMFTYEGRECPGGTNPLDGLTIDATAYGNLSLCPSCPCLFCGEGGGGPGVSAAVQTTRSSCNQCIQAVIDATVECVAPTPFQVGYCLGSTIASGGGLMDYAKCIPVPMPPGVQCAASIGTAIGTCLNSVDWGAPLAAGLSSSLRSESSGQELGAVFEQVHENISIVLSAYRAREAWALLYFGNMAYTNAFDELAPLLEPYIVNESLIPPNSQTALLSDMAGYDISASEIQSFFDRWNSTMDAWGQDIFIPNPEYPNIINGELVMAYSDTIETAVAYAQELGFNSIDDMYAADRSALDEIFDSPRNSVCASVTIQLSQTLTMTREAFSGTLVINNGHPTDAMDSLTVNVLITDEDGVLSNGLFQINTQSVTNLGDVTGTGSLEAQEEGSVQFLMIPTIAAAPTQPKVYNFGGIVSYWDPFVDTLVTFPLNPVPLTVKPSPDLMLHYFMERNILGDDALTSDVVEPMIPAQLAVMVENHGYGPAVNMKISSAQPEIIENESGLAINFELIGSNLQGQPTALGVIDIPFGTIPALSTRIGQWYMTSSLLGKFVDYEADVVHNNSFGNPELSLIQGVELHELTRSMKVYGAMDDDMGDFLVNDLFDPNDVPDVIFLSQGNITYEVVGAENGSFSEPVQPPSFTNTLTVTAEEPGWNYIKLDDPGYGQYDLVSVTRDSDGQPIPLNNAWLTFVTLPVGQEHFYENKFHFVDTFATAGAPETYTVVWTPKDFDVPEVVRIEGAPENVTTEQVTELMVVFSKPIDPSTFTHDDLTLVFQGGPNIMDASAIITQVNDSTFTVDLSTLTTGNGSYLFTAQAYGVSDIYGINGLVGEQVFWTQFLTVPTVQAFQGIPSPAIASSYDTIRVLFNLPIDLSSAPPERFSILYEGEAVAGSLTIDSVRADGKLFYLSGLGALLVEDGTYELVVDLPAIRSQELVYGMQPQSTTLTVDNAGPVLVTLEPSTQGGLDTQHRTQVAIVFNEAVVGFNTSALQVTRNGENIPLNIAQLSFLSPTEWKAGAFGLSTYYDGDYVFQLDMGLVTDALGNTGTGIAQVAWTVDHMASISITDLAIDPDLGHSSTDGISSTLGVDVQFSLSAIASQVTVSQTSFGSEQVLATLSDVPGGPVSVPITFNAGGNTGVKIVAVGGSGGNASTQRALFLDQVPLTATWGLSAGTEHAEQFSAIGIAFSERLLTTAGILSNLRLYKDGTEQTTDGLAIEQSDETNFVITGFETAHPSPGTYELIIDLSQLAKYSSGRTGAGPRSVTWRVLPTPSLRLAAKALLSGPFDPFTGLMYDSLRTRSSIPLTEPYTAQGRVWSTGEGGESISPPVLNVQGPNAIVDWVVVELRDVDDPGRVVADRAALIQRDGDIVDTDGTSVVLFDPAPERFLVAIHHRNHLGVLGSTPLERSANAIGIDLTLPSTPTWGANARTLFGNQAALWCGDVVNDGTVLYTGQENDRDPILSAIGGIIPTNTITGYHSTDVNMDGIVKYTGSGNDRDRILEVIGGLVPTAIRTEQLP